MSKAKVKRVLAYKKVNRHWLLFGNGAKKVEDLPFVGRDSEDRLNWWTVTPPKTDHWHVHKMLGRSYALDLLDLVHNPEAEKPEHIIRCIADAMMQWRTTVEPCAGQATPPQGRLDHPTRSWRPSRVSGLEGRAAPGRRIGGRRSRAGCSDILG